MKTDKITLGNKSVIYVKKGKSKLRAFSPKITVYKDNQELNNEKERENGTNRN